MSPGGKAKVGRGYGRWNRKRRKVAVFKDLERWEAREIGDNYKALLSTKQLNIS